MILQVARTELGTDDVILAPHTTGAVGSAGSASASRMTWMAAGAVRDACRAALEERERLGGGEVDVERVYRHPRTTPLDPETGQITGDRAHVALAVSAMRVVVEVDVELGLTRVVWVGTAQDVGKAINPLAVEGQIEGGTAQGLGLALMEELVTRDGAILNASFTDYLLPTALDMPPVAIELVEVPEPDAPYGVKGVGEPPDGRLHGGDPLRHARGDRPTADARPGTAGRHLPLTWGRPCSPRAPSSAVTTRPSTAGLPAGKRRPPAANAAAPLVDDAFELHGSGVASQGRADPVDLVLGHRPREGKRERPLERRVRARERSAIAVRGQAMDGVRADLRLDPLGAQACERLVAPVERDDVRLPAVPVALVG